MQYPQPYAAAHAEPRYSPRRALATLTVLTLLSWLAVALVYYLLTTLL